jgi:hypothetical protein
MNREQNYSYATENILTEMLMQLIFAGWEMCKLFDVLAECP